jgi:hypothetical protein
MSTRVGLRLHYQKTDAVYMAFRVAELAQSLGFDVEILPRNKPSAIHPAWDKNVFRHSGIDYYTWIKEGVSRIVFFGQAAPNELQAAQKAGVKTILVVLWDQIEIEDTNLYHLFDGIVCPAKKVARLLADKMGLDNICCVPWDPGIPITNDYREIDIRKVTLLWSLDGSQCVHQEPKFISVVENLLASHSNTFITITYNNILPPKGVTELKKLIEYGDGRVNLVSNPSIDRHMLMYGQHDLTIWPSLIESVGLVGLSSLYMGTPVIAFNHPLVSEIVKDGKNSELVPCDLQLNWLGVPYVQPNYAIFGRQLSRLVENPEKLSQMREWTSSGLRERQDLFQDRWAKLLGYEFYE